MPLLLRTVVCTRQVDPKYYRHIAHWVFTILMKHEYAYSSTKHSIRDLQRGTALLYMNGVLWRQPAIYIHIYDRGPLNGLLLGQRSWLPQRARPARPLTSNRKALCQTVKLYKRLRELMFRISHWSLSNNSFDSRVPRPQFWVQSYRERWTIRYSSSLSNS